MSNAAKLGLPEIFNLVIGSPARALLVALFVTPGLMFIIGWIGESRTLPIGKKQFFGFFPGEFFLAIGFSWSVGSVSMMPEVTGKWYQSDYWHLLVAVGAFVIGLVVRHTMDKPNYPRKAFRSPTKIYHDYFLYIAYGFMMVIVTVPACVEQDYGFGNPPIVSVLSLAVWAQLVFVTDNVRGPKNMAKYAHVEDWVPIWKK